MSHKLTKSRVNELLLPSTVTALSVPPHQWIKTLDTYVGQRKINVNRLRYLNIPVEVTAECTNAGRDGFIREFWQSLVTNVMSDNSRFAYFNKAVTFLRFSDEIQLNLFTKQGVNQWIKSQYNRVLNGKITEATASAEVGACRKFITLCGLNSKDLFPEHNPFSERARGTKDIRTLPYTKKEEKQLIRAIENLYQQLKQHLLNTPEKPIAEILFDDKYHKVPASANFQINYPAFYKRSLVACAFYKMSVYTGYNSGTLTNLKHSQINKIDTNSGHIYRLNPTKGRKGGAIDSKEISTPKQIAFLDEWLLLIPNLANSECDWVFPILNLKEDRYLPLTNIDVTARINSVIQRIYHPISDKGEPLLLSASRFRKNRNLIAHYVAGPIMAAHDANHSVAVEDRFYGTIHPHEGMKQTAATVDVLAQLGRAKDGLVNIQEAKAEVARKWNIELLPLDDAFRLYGKLNTMPNGIRCKNGYEGVNPEKYQRMQQKSSDSNSTSLPCALYQNCLSCSQAVLIDSDNDAYLLLSFREYIVNSTTMHLDGNHLEKNYGELLSQIETAISMLSKNYIDSAKHRVFGQGLHPFWNRFSGASN